MSKYLRNLKKVVDDEYVDYSKWLKIVENADRDTLKYLNTEGFQTLKHFTRDDWIACSHREEIKNMALNRIHQMDVDNWHSERFGKDV